MCAAHVLKYVHNLTPANSNAITLGSYWADNSTYAIVKVLSSNLKKLDDIDVLHVEYLTKPGSRVAIQSDDLLSDFTRIEKPKSAKLFYWFFKHFEKRRILTLHDVESTPNLKHLYVMNALTMESLMWQRKQSVTVTYPIPQLLIPLKNERGSTEVLTVHPSFAPVDVLQLFKASMLFDANDFRNAVNKGHLYLLDPKYAQRLLSLPEIAAEVERLDQIADDLKSTYRGNFGGDVNSEPGGLPPYYVDHGTDLEADDEED